MMEKNKQLPLPGLKEALERSSSIKADDFLSATKKQSASIIDFHKEKLKIDREEEKKQIDSFLDYYKIF